MMALIVFLPKLKKTEDPLKRLPFAIAGIFLSLIVGAGALFIYRSLVPHYFVWFGVTTIATFLIAVIVRTVPQILQVKHRVQ